MNKVQITWPCPIGELGIAGDFNERANWQDFRLLLP
jgi:hypothetical protein